MAAAKPRQFPVTPRDDAGLRGRLEQFGLATVLGFLDLERRSGQILVVSGDKVGRVCVRGGQVLSARIEGSRRVNRSAIYELLSWNRGWFTFSQEELPSVVDEIGAPTTLLLVDAARRSDEAVAAAAAY
jgi:ferric-dicitrate binding protein FerR (iron transport regulator)